MDTDGIIAAAFELLAVPSTADRPADLRRALDFMIDFVGPGFTVEHFESGGKASVLIYPGPRRRNFRIMLNAHVDVIPAAVEQFHPRIDIRFIPEDPAFSRRTVPEITAHLCSFCEAGVVPVVVHASPPHRVDAGRPEIGRIRAAAERQGYRSGLLRRHGASDGRFYSQHGIDAVIFGIDGAGQHSAEEYADVASISAYYHALRDFLSDPGDARVTARK